MPSKKEDWMTVPVALEHKTYSTLAACMQKYGLARLKLLRMIVKYAISRPDLMQEIVAAGDPAPK